MRRIIALTTVAVLVCMMFGNVLAQDTEQDIVNRYLQMGKEKYTQKIGWASATFGMDRINRNNDYNTFATRESQNLEGAGLNWLDMGTSLGVEFGMVFNRRIAWHVGGEYWMKMGDDIAGNPVYLPTSTEIENPKSEIKVYGITTGVQYYLVNPPDTKNRLSRIAVRAGGTLGYYFANWDLWDQYQNLNLSTSAADEENTTYKGSAPGFSFNLGADYPLKFWDLAIGAEMGYLYLNFNNVAWYNSQDEEIVASYDGTPDGRVDLAFSGVKGKIEIKRFFSW